MTAIGIILSAAAILLMVPVAILFVEIFCALVARPAEVPAGEQRQPGMRVAVLIPAHNEENGIGETVAVLANQIGTSDKLIVVADNCSDATAARARAAGAETIERHELARRGKGYALEFGIRHLECDPPDVVLIVDADCRLGPSTIDTLVACVHATRRPAQALYDMSLPEHPDAKRRVAGFAWIVKNQVRPAGLAVLNLPCQLMGTGMAFPWAAIRRIDLATGNIVEDIKMGLDLAAAGVAPVYCPQARVVSEFPPTERGFAVQRQRWEGGSLHTGLGLAPVMLLRGLVTFNWPLAAMAADLIVPPVMLLMSVLVIGALLSGVFALAGGCVLPLVIFMILLVAVLLALGAAWFQRGRHVLRPGDLLALPGVFAQKLSLYASMLRNRGAGWVRTDRK